MHTRIIVIAAYSSSLFYPSPSSSTIVAPSRTTVPVFRCKTDKLCIPLFMLARRNHVRRLTRSCHALQAFWLRVCLLLREVRRTVYGSETASYSIYRLWIHGRALRIWKSEGYAEGGRERERRNARLVKTVRKIRKAEEEMPESDKLFISHTWEAIARSFALSYCARTRVRIFNELWNVRY